jgi:hypothetical protein
MENTLAGIPFFETPHILIISGFFHKIKNKQKLIYTQQRPQPQALPK